MVFSNLKVRLESLSTTTRQVITTPIPSGGFWPALSIASVLTAVCHTYRERSPTPHATAFKIYCVEVHCIRATRYYLPVFTLAKGCVCSVRCHVAIFLLFLPEQH